MNHTEAVRLQAAEKYALGDLSQAVREEYEEHFFDCAECALDLKAAVAFVAATREVLREEGRATSLARDPDRVPIFAAWKRFFRPLVAVPVFAALLLAVIYQQTRMPSAREVTPLAAAQVSGSSFLLKSGLRGGEEKTIQVPRDQAFTIGFDITSLQSFPNYLCQLEDAKGHVLVRMPVSSTQAADTVYMPVPGGLRDSGTYSVVVTGTEGSASKEVQRRTFTVEFLR